MQRLFNGEPYLCKWSQNQQELYMVMGLSKEAIRMGNIGTGCGEQEGRPERNGAVQDEALGTLHPRDVQTFICRQA